MAKLQQVLGEEIRRLSRKEVFGVMKTLRSQVSELKNQVRDLNKRIKVLEKYHPETRSSAMENMGDEAAAKNVRISPDRIRKWRKKLGVSQSQYAALLDVNTISVNHWETGKTVPRSAQKQKIAFLRDAGKRRIVKLLSEKQIEIKKKNVNKTAAVSKKTASAAKPAKPVKQAKPAKQTKPVKQTRQAKAGAKRKA